VPYLLMEMRSGTRTSRRASRQTSDEKLFGSIVVAKAVAAAKILEDSLPKGDPEASDYEEDEDREECEEVARVKYRHALRRLAEAFS